MPEKKEGVPTRYLDRRVAERYVKRGLLDEKEYQKYLKSLPDLAETADKIDTEFASGDDLGPTR